MDVLTGSQMDEQTEAGTAEAYQLDESIGFILRQVLQRNATIFSAHIGEVTTMQWAALSKLSEVGSCSQNLLGRMTGMDAPTVKGVVERMIKRGFITNRPDPTHKRRAALTLTEAGQALISTKSAAANAVSRETLRPLSAKEADRFTELLKRLR